MQARQHGEPELTLRLALQSNDSVEVGILGGDIVVPRRLAGGIAAGILPSLATGGAAGRGAARNPHDEGSASA